MSRARGSFAVLLVLAAGPLSGCSLVLVRRAPPVVSQEQWLPCTDLPFWPVVDTTNVAAGVLGMAGVVTSLNTPGGSFNTDLGRSIGAPLVLGMLGVYAVGFGYSAVMGFKDTSHCASIHEAYERRIESQAGLTPVPGAGGDPAPSAVPPPPPAPDRSDAPRR